MTLDFSPPERNIAEDIQSLLDDLARTAPSWVPELFPYGVKQSRDWRIGSLEGEKGNSTSIRLYGDRAGCFVDHADSDYTKGGPLELIKIAYGCDFKEAILRAQEILRKPRPICKDVLDDKTILARDNHKVQKIWKAGLCLGTATNLDKRTKIPLEYLKRRGVFEVRSHEMRSVPELFHYPSKEFHPAIISAIRNPIGTLIGVHRIFLDKDGNKANITPNKMILGNCKGGAVMLTPRGDSEILGLAEGIETAMAAQVLNPDIPVWSVLSTAGLTSFEPVKGITTYKIFADNDKPGIDAANKLKNKLAKVGCSVTIVIPSMDGCKDFNDQLLFKKETEYEKESNV